MLRNYLNLRTFFNPKNWLVDNNKLSEMEYCARAATMLAEEIWQIAVPPGRSSKVKTYSSSAGSPCSFAWFLFSFA